MKSSKHKGGLRWKAAGAIALGIFLLFTITLPAFAGVLSTNGGCENGTYGYGPGAGYAQNQSSVNLPVGCVVQYIFAGANDVPDAIDTTTRLTTGDDAIIATYAVGGDNVFVLVTGEAGLFYNSVIYTNANVTSAHHKVFMRTFNTNNITTATYYGNSAAWDGAYDATFTPYPNDFCSATFNTSNSIGSSTTAPTVTSVSPNSGMNTGTTSITIEGMYYTGLIWVHLGATDLSYSVVNSTTITATVPAGLTAGPYDITVNTANGTSVITPNCRFTVTAPGVPAFVSITPNSGNQGATLNSVAIVGSSTHFFDGTTTVVISGSDVTISNISVSNATNLTCTIVIGATAATGARNVYVTTGTEEIVGTFTVSTPGGPGGPGNAIYEKAGGIMMAYPNPFNPNDAANPLKMLFNTATGEAVDIYIFDTNARVIYQTRDRQLAADRIVEWDGDTSYGETVENGLYLIRVVKDGKLVAKGKILVIKK
jgi:hypothetical protein